MTPLTAERIKEVKDFDALIELLRNEQFRDNADTTVEQVFYYAIENADAVFARYRADELDFTTTIPARQLDFIRASMPGDYVQSPYLGTYYYGFNVTKPPFQNEPGLRRALSMAIDREIITEKLTGAGELPATGEPVFKPLSQISR